MSVIPPPPPQYQNAQRPDNGCWKWGLIGCGGLGCVAVIAVVAMVVMVMRSPIGKQATKSAFEMQAAQQQLMTVGKALDRYVEEKKKYPDKLDQLVPNYVPDKKGLTVPGVAGAPAIEYKKPPEGANDSTVVLQTQVSAPVPFPDAPPWIIRYTKGGRVQPAEYNYTDQGGKTHKVGGARF